jgi:hypothetical protein
MSNRIAHYLAGGEGGTTIQYSEDGMDWYNSTNAFDTKCNKIVCLPETGFCVAVGEDTGGKSIKYSDDGKTWTDSDVTNTDEIKDLIYFIQDYDTNLWLAMSENAAFYISTDGKKWTLASSLQSDSYTKDSGFTQGESLVNKNNSLWALGSGTTKLIEITIGVASWSESPYFFYGNSLTVGIDAGDNLIKLKNLKSSQQILGLGDNPKSWIETQYLFKKIPDLKVTLSSDSQTGIFSAEQVNDKIFIGSDKNVYVMDSDLKLVTKKDFFSNTVNEKYTLTDSTKINSLLYDLLHNFTFVGITTTGGSTSSIQYYSDSSKIFLNISSGGFTTGCYMLTTRTAPQSEIDKVAKKADVTVKDTSNNNNTSSFKPTSTSTPSKTDTPSVPPPVKTVSNKTQRPPPLEMHPAPKKSSGRSVKVHHTKVL